MELLQAVLYVFRQFYRSNANLDLYYLLGAVLLLMMTFRYKYMLRQLFLWFVPFVVMVITNYLFLGVSFSIGESITYLGKILLCMALMVVVKHKWENLNYKKWIMWVTFLYFILDVVAVIFSESQLWRHNDTINKYNETRLQLFCYEPSELSMCCTLLLLVVIFGVGQSFTRLEIFGVVAVLGITTVFTAGMGGILAFGVAFLCAMMYKYRSQIRNLRLNKWIISAVFVALAAFFLLMQTDISYVKRIKEIMSGNDASLWGRFTVPVNILKLILLDSSGAGMGFGNMGSDQGIQAITEYAAQLNYTFTLAFPNSFMRFIGEGGIWAVIYLAAIFGVLFTRAYKSNEPLKIAILVYIFVYQIPGGYFTNPLNWVCYGLVLAQTQGELKKDKSRDRKIYEKENNFV